MSCKREMLPKCNKTRHCEVVCKTKIVGAVKSNDNNFNTDDGSAWFLGNIIGDNDCNGDKCFVELPSNDTTVKFRIDRGADITVMSVHTYQCVEEHPVLKSSGNTSFSRSRFS